MLYLIGLVFALSCVFGSFVLSGGSLSPLVHSVPFEMLTIGGAAAGIFVMSNGKDALMVFPKYIVRALKGPRYSKADYMELLLTLFRFMRLAQTKGNMALENHIENPEESSIFALSPNVRNDKVIRSFICDYLRLISLDMDDAFQMDDVMSQELQKNLKEDLVIAESLASIADALPALGIVAAVLGVIKTMAAISKPPVILGTMIASALVGTFLGILLSYGVVGPLAAKMKGVVLEDARYPNIIRTVLVAHLQGMAPQICVELGRKDIPQDIMPSFSELDSAMSEAKNPKQDAGG